MIEVYKNWVQASSESPIEFIALVTVTIFIIGLAVAFIENVIKRIKK